MEERGLLECDSYHLVYDYHHDDTVEECRVCGGKSLTTIQVAGISERRDENQRDLDRDDEWKGTSYDRKYSHIGS